MPTVMCGMPPHAWARCATITPPRGIWQALSAHSARGDELHPCGRAPTQDWLPISFENKKCSCCK